MVGVKSVKHPAELTLIPEDWRMKPNLLFAVGLFFLIANTADAEMRQWTDKLGTHAVQAEFIGVAGDHVVLKRQDGPTIRVPLETLSPQDQQYVRRKTAASPSANGLTPNREASRSRIRTADPMMLRDAARQFIIAASEHAARITDGVAPTIEPYCNIAVVQSQLGDVIGARKGLEAVRRAVSLLDEADRASEYACVAETQAMTGDAAEAKNTALLITDNDTRENACVKVQAKLGDVAGAKRTASQIVDDAYKAMAYEDIAQSQLEVGDATGARQTLAEAGKVVSRLGRNSGGQFASAALIYKSIAKAQIKAGDLPGARQSLDGSRAAVAHMRPGWDNPASYYAKIANEQVKAGDLSGAQQSLEEAGKTVAQYSNNQDQADAYAAMAEAYVRSGDLATAKKIAAEPTEIFAKLSAYVRIVTMQAAAGDIAGAKETTASVKELSGNVLGDEAYAKIALAQVKAGDVLAARETLKLLSMHSSDTMCAFISLAVEQARTGDVPGAINLLVSSADEERERSLALVEAAKELCAAPGVRLTVSGEGGAASTPIPVQALAGHQLSASRDNDERSTENSLNGLLEDSTYGSANRAIAEAVGGQLPKPALSLKLHELNILAKRANKSGDNLVNAYRETVVSLKQKGVGSPEMLAIQVLTDNIAWGIAYEKGQRGN